MKNKSDDYKLTAVQYYLVEDITQKEVCKIFKCSLRSLMRWVDKYKKDGELTGYNRIPKAYKVHKEHVEFLLQEIKKNIEIYLREHMKDLKNMYQIKRHEKSRRIIYKIGVLNEKRCNS